MSRPEPSGVPTEDADQHEDRATRWAGSVFERIEHLFYIVLGVILSISAALALVSAVIALTGSMRDLAGTGVLIDLTDRLLFVLMLVEILHTVRVSLRTGVLTPEPFLVVGLIASIRRVLVITLESSQATTASNWNDQTEAIFRSSMIELGVLGMLIIVMVVSIYLINRLRQSRERSADGAAHPERAVA